MKLFAASISAVLNTDDPRPPLQVSQYLQGETAEGGEFNRIERTEHKEKNKEGKGLRSKLNKEGRGRQMFCCQGDLWTQSGFVVNDVIAMWTAMP